MKQGDDVGFVRAVMLADIHQEQPRTMDQDM